jgi:hypothetical protein
MRRSIITPALCLLSLGQTMHAADALFATDLGSQTLLTVDVATGSVDVIGVVPSEPGLLLDLAAIGPRLFGLRWAPGVPARLIEISPVDATVLSSVPITVDGLPSINATEGLTSSPDGSLLVSLWRPGASSTSSSNAIGRLGIDGVVTDIVDFGSDADFDGLGDDPNGGSVGLDRTPGLDFVDLLNVSYPAGTATLIVRIPFSPNFNLVDDVVVLDGDIVTLDASTRRINRHDRVTGLVESFVEYPADLQLYAGLAVVSLPDGCPADLDGDRTVGAQDLAILLGDWGGRGSSDLDASGSVGAADLAILLGAWGPCG